MFNPDTSADSNRASGNGNTEDNLEEGIMLYCSNSLNTILKPNYLSSKEFELISGKDYWHKVTVLNTANSDKEAILKRIMDFVHPMDMIPAMCRDDGVNTYFLIRRCRNAIEKLCRMKMTLDYTPKLNLQIILGFAHVKDIPLNMQDCLTKVIKKRYNHTRKHLDLSNFHRDPDLVDMFYCPLSQSKILNYVLNNGVICQLPLVTVNLANNDISFVRNRSTPSQLKHITKLDLRHNLISSTAELTYLRHYQLREILLDQNPICELFTNEYDYIKAIQNVLPTLVKLDGVTVPAPGFPRFMKNFILSQDHIPLVDQFLRQYFTLYDGNNRRKLIGLYHKEALFSLSATYLPAQSTSNTARLTEYTIGSRNLHKLSDYSKNLKLLHQGPEAIVGTLCKLPRTEHDPYSFTVDVVDCNPGVMITVKGVFREPATFKTPLVRSFYRVFILVEVGRKSYQIANETMHISNAASKEEQAAFKITKPVITPKMLASKEENLKDTEKDQIANTMSKLTTMNKKWSRKCLDETKWDIKEALIVFTELYKMNKIPQEAFFSRI